MIDNQMRDLKDFITTIVHQKIGSRIKDQTTELYQEFGELKSRFGGSEQAVSDIDLKVDTIADAIGVRFDNCTTQLDNHETHIANLETASALTV